MCYARVSCLVSRVSSLSFPVWILQSSGLCTINSQIALELERQREGARGRERGREGVCQLLAYCLAALPPAATQLVPPARRCISHFMCVNISKSPSALRAKWFTCQSPYQSLLYPLPPPCQLPTSFFIFSCHSTVGIVYFMALLHCPHSPCEFLLSSDDFVVVVAFDFVIEI